MGNMMMITCTQNETSSVLLMAMLAGSDQTLPAACESLLPLYRMHGSDGLHTVQCRPSPEDGCTCWVAMLLHHA
jgi:hypothetical protein